MSRTTEHRRMAAAAWESLFRAQVAVIRNLQADPAFKRVNMREYDVLFNLSRCPSGWLRLNELNDHVLLSQPSISRMVDRLERQGLVQRRSVELDRRGVLIGLTEAGRTLQREIGREHARDIDRLVGAGLSGEELQTLKVLTDKLRASIQGSPAVRTRNSTVGSNADNKHDSTVGSNADNKHDSTPDSGPDAAPPCGAKASA
ncbi:winged helix-turn-helix transcriptional regulator [Paenarthrobacter sp. Z7-10]|uniref:MarR family winged helix-turn-helix transcriptional regulator n=1 Tax=Paenarthrobacter sp. Z7-10 TaxID=2787635 RepID=UPI002E7665CC|nr:MarR family winged helix-turn-helix transcriptional regulator [Paenarthrobacter sp. Z7-10]MCZ2404665.1 winged helix-turn-helix transcriptional regulator [Paenarthrobacter sp. Z7-10]